MNIRKKGSLILTLLFLSFIQFSIIAQSQDVLKIREALTAKIDSVNNNSLKLDENLKASMIVMANKTGEYETVANFFKQKKLVGEEYQVMMNKYMSRNSLDSTYLYFKRAENYYLNNEKETPILINSIRAQFIGWCASNNYSELAINTLKQNIEYNSARKLDDNLWTYMLLVQIHRAAGNHEQAIESGKIGLKQASTHKFTPEFKMCICYEIAESYYSLGDYQNCLAYSDSILTYTKKIPNRFQADFGSNIHNLALIDFYSIKSVGYSSIKDFGQASLMLLKLETIFSEIDKLENADYVKNGFIAQKNWANMIYNYQKGDYSKAMEYLSENKKLSIPYALSPDYKSIPKWEARILEKMRKYKEANLALKEQIHLTDSINKGHASKEISSLWAIFEVDKAQQAKENSEAKVKMIGISTSAIILTFILLIIYFVINNKKLKKKNQLLFKQQKNQTSAIPFVLNSKKEVSQEERKEEEVHENPEQTLYLRIIEYLQTTKQYTDSDISRESLAKELGTNRQYIIDAISNNSNMSFNEFINDFRIDYARNLLLNEENILIKEVYTDAGFKNRNTFSQLFKEKFGMSPSEFRECANEEKIKR